MGTFGFLRYAFPLFPSGALEFRPYLAAVAVVGIVYGALMCFAQNDMKKLVAYSSVSHLGFVMLGLCALTTSGVDRRRLSDAQPRRLDGGTLRTRRPSSMSDATPARWGNTRRHRQDGARARGALSRRHAWRASGLPGTNGFVGEFLILAGAFNSRLAPWYAVFGALGVILGAVYMLWMYQRVFFGPVKREENKVIADLSLREWAVVPGRRWWCSSW